MRCYIFQVDCGASPGAWSQVAAEKVGRTGLVVAADIQGNQSHIEI